MKLFMWETNCKNEVKLFSVSWKGAVERSFWKNCGVLSSLSQSWVTDGWVRGNSCVSLPSPRNAATSDLHCSVIGFYVTPVTPLSLKPVTLPQTVPRSLLSSVSAVKEKDTSSEWDLMKRDSWLTEGASGGRESQPHDFTLSILWPPPCHHQPPHTLTPHILSQCGGLPHRPPFVLAIITLTSSQLWSCVNISTGKIQTEENKAWTQKTASNLTKSQKKNPAFPHQGGLTMWCQ